MLIVPKISIELWQNYIKLYIPNLDYIVYSSMNNSEDCISQYEFFSSKSYSIKFDLMIITHEDYNKNYIY